jgi:hypothetical protein
VLRRYWQPVGGTLGIAVSVGLLIQQGRDAKADLETIKAAQAAQTAQNAAVNERLTRLEADWHTLYGAAAITIVPKEAEEKKKGKVKR